MNKKQDILYGAMYNGMIYESSHATLSLHWTKEGAQKAIELHKMEVKVEHDKQVEYWKDKDSDYEKKINMMIIKIGALMNLKY